MSPSPFPKSLLSGTWKSAVRAQLETAIPPVFGKEMKWTQDGQYLKHGIGFFNLRL